MTTAVTASMVLFLYLYIRDYLYSIHNLTLADWPAGARDVSNLPRHHFGRQTQYLVP